MDPSSGLDLGHGVRVVAESGGGLVVWAEDLDLGWRERSPKVPGTAVEWEERLYEVVGHSGGDRVIRWQLEPWDEATVMRSADRLDAEVVAQRAGSRDREQDEARTRFWMVVMLPILGFAPGWLQAEWSRRLGYPAMAGVVLTSLIEVAAGGVGLMQGLTAALGGELWLPWWLSWLVVVGPLMGIEGLIRLQYGSAHSEPLGSVFSLPVHLVVSRPAPAVGPPSTAPRVHAFDDAAGSLEIASPAQRPDWAEGGVLPYRGRWFHLSSTRRLGSDWLYRFEEVVDGGEDGLRVLHLAARPAPREAPPELDRGAGGWLGLSLRTALFCFAPGPLQTEWVRRVGGSAGTLTAAGAGVEVVGGLVNLVTGDLSSPLVLLDVVVLGEGLVRLGVLGLTGRPVGSVPGQILRPVYERWLRP